MVHQLREMEEQILQGKKAKQEQREKEKKLL